MISDPPSKKEKRKKNTLLILFLALTPFLPLPFEDMLWPLHPMPVAPFLL